MIRIISGDTNFITGQAEGREFLIYMSENNKKIEEKVAPVKSKLAEREEEILKSWQENNIFQKTLSKISPKGEFVFFDGPPFATGLPHFGHILAGTMKDYIGRYKTMRGYNVPRKWGWDCHGLPVENIVEKELGFKSKKDIEDFGLEKFNDIARSKVFTYVNDWKKIVPRMGRFVDMEDDYKTLSPSYMESVWNIFNELNKKGLIYEDFKTMHLCPHCGTTLSNFEVSQGYKDITDISVTIKFELVDEPNTFFLAWTTTPWTLPGNVALAVNSETEYIKVQNLKGKNQGLNVKVLNEKYIIAEPRASSVLKDYDYEIVEKIKGSALVGLSYKPLFDYYSKTQINADKNTDIADKDVDKRGNNISENQRENQRKSASWENGFKVYSADFVTTEDGTGIVHIAPAFGEDDMNLGRKEKLPFVQHVGLDGKFKSEVKEFAGKKVKPSENPQEADIEVLKYLAGVETLFSKEKFTHSYPHCWRCNTPLLNYATTSWFVEVTKIKDKLVNENKKIKWVPKEVGDGRFGKWLEGARDWSISRSRFWGCPLPVWKCKKCEAKQFFGSVDEIKEKTDRKNKFLVVRHGEAESNALGIISSNPKTNHHLTDEGKKQAEEASEKIGKEKVDIIYCSPFLRTKETAEIIAEKIGYSKDKIVYDDRLHEIYVGALDGKPDPEYQAFFKDRSEKFYKAPEGGEDYTVVKNRMTDFLYDINSKNEGKNILIVSHNTPIWLMFGGAFGMTPNEIMAMREVGKPFIYNSEIKELKFAPIPHNRKYELDLHRPFIDELVLKCDCGDEMRRIPEVFDCWFESGSMPYGQSHYPFENLDKFNPIKNKNFPADFIAEGVDQTRGWFYSMLVLSVALFGESSFKNVIVNGMVLAEDGKKMSKSLKNYTDPMELVNLYGADAMRYYLLSSPVMKAEDLNFSNKGVDEIVKKTIMRLQNVYSFFEMYGGTDADASSKSKVKSLKSENVLDKWILARLKETATQITKSTDEYELDRATWPIADFVDDISTWYLRRSRDRFKSEDLEDKNSAMLTTKILILELSKLLAPSMPFLADDLYLKITGGLLEESVHLESWPEGFVGELSDEEKTLLLNMKEIRNIVSLGLEARAKSGIKVRQPLASLKVHPSQIKNQFDGARSLKFKVGEKDGEDFFKLVKDEINVKEVIVDEKIAEALELDINITPELKEEGIARDIIRAIQEMRKNNKLNPEDLVGLSVDTDERIKNIINKFEKEISKTTGIKDIFFKEIADGETLEFDGSGVRMNIG